MESEPTAPSVGKTPQSPDPANQGLASGVIAPSEDFDDWLENFYRECGREVTLAYTTLNQMKNWAVAIVAAVVSAVVALTRPGTSASASGYSSDLTLYAGSLIVYCFTLRFFVRAILCYINLVRWNNLQSAVVELKLVPRISTTSPSRTTDELRRALLQMIQDLYFDWRAPSALDRRAQVVSNLKLGFALLLAIPIFFAILSGSRVSFNDPLARGMTVFAIGYTFVEAIDFWRSSLFDTPEVHKRRKRRIDRDFFPTPVSKGEYLAYWLLNLGLSVLAAFWPSVAAFVRRGLCGG